MSVGIEAINCYVGRAFMDVETIFRARGLSMERLQNLMMVRKSVNLPIEDPITNAVNAAKPLIDAMSDDERAAIEIVVVGTESGIDFGKPFSTYVAHHLGLPRHCRSFEVKHACYGGTAALQSAAAMVESNPRPGVKALVIAADASSVAARNTYWEPSQGAGAVAMVVGEDPRVLSLDRGANGYYSFEVMDTLRPRPDLEAGDSDLSILSYMTCLKESFAHYARIVADVDLKGSFDFLLFHSPFAGLVKSAHRRLMTGARLSDIDLDEDFDRRMRATLELCQNVGNIYSAAVYLGLCSLLEYGEIEGGGRIGIFSYGSGCASEFYSGVIDQRSQAEVRRHGIDARLADRALLEWETYEEICDLSLERMAGVEDLKPDTSAYAPILADRFEGRGLLVLEEIRNFHRRYRFA
jgi:polyketide biosynthesis 3-hydroxy-3-methylglutaryl-CoA synthase-like enzyme PksG